MIELSIYASPLTVETRKEKKIQNLAERILEEMKNELKRGEFPSLASFNEKCSAAFALLDEKTRSLLEKPSAKEFKNSVKKVKETLPEMVQMLIEVAGDDRKLRQLAVVYGIVLSILIKRLENALKKERYNLANIIVNWITYIAFLVGAFFTLVIEDSRVRPEILECIEKTFVDALNKTV